MSKPLSHEFPALAAFFERHPRIRGAEDVLALRDDSFVATYARSSFDNDTRPARRLHCEAARVQEMIVLLWCSIKDAVSSPYSPKALYTSIDIPASFIEHPLVTPSYKHLFGNLDDRAYDECRAVDGPAACFVDLMRFVERNVAVVQRYVRDGAHHRHFQRGA